MAIRKHGKEDVMQVNASIAVVIVLFKLKSGVSLEEYRAFSKESVRPEMLRWQSIISFGDYEAERNYGLGDPLDHELLELIYVTSPKAFIEDNESPSGAVLARKWEALVSRSSVVFFKNLHQFISYQDSGAKNVQA